MFGADAHADQACLRKAAESKLAAGRKVIEVGKRNGRVSDIGRQSVCFLMRQLQKFFQEIQLVQHFEGRRVDRVAPEVAQKIGVLFENDDFDSRAREQKPQHHSRRTTARDAARRFKHISDLVSLASVLYARRQDLPIVESGPAHRTLGVDARVVLAARGLLHGQIHPSRSKP